MHAQGARATLEGRGNTSSTPHVSWVRPRYLLLADPRLGSDILRRRHVLHGPARCGAACRRSETSRSPTPTTSSSRGSRTPSACLSLHWRGAPRRSAGARPSVAGFGFYEPFSWLHRRPPRRRIPSVLPGEITDAPLIGSSGWCYKLNLFRCAEVLVAHRLLPVEMYVTQRRCPAGGTRGGCACRCSALVAFVISVRRRRV